MYKSNDCDKNLERNKIYKVPVPINFFVTFSQLISITLYMNKFNLVNAFN